MQKYVPVAIKFSLAATCYSPATYQQHCTVRLSAEKSCSAVAHAGPPETQIQELSHSKNTTGWFMKTLLTDYCTQHTCNSAYNSNSIHFSWKIKLLVERHPWTFIFRSSTQGFDLFLIITDQAGMAIDHRTKWWSFMTSQSLQGGHCNCNIT